MTVFSRTLRPCIGFAIAYVLFLQVFLLGTAQAMQFAESQNQQNAFNPYAIICLTGSTAPDDGQEHTSHDTQHLSFCCPAGMRLDTALPPASKILPISLVLHQDRTPAADHATPRAATRSFQPPARAPPAA